MGVRGVQSENKSTLEHIKNNIVGKRFNDITVLEYLGKDYSKGMKNVKRIWKIKCENCGEIKILNKWDVSVLKTCGCRPIRFDIVGRKFGKLFVVGVSKILDPQKERLYICTCECGNERLYTASVLRKNNSCGCLKNRKRGPRFHSKNNKYNNYRLSAKRRGLEFSLSIEEFDFLTSLPCYYCGEAPRPNKLIHNVPFNGIDRVKNELGYIFGNCAPCCIMCNNAKKDVPLIDFLVWIDEVYKHLHKDPRFGEVLHTTKQVLGIVSKKEN